MRKTMFILAMCTITIAFAKAVGPLALGDAVFVDTEASTNVPLPACAGDPPHVLAFSLDFVGTPSNAVEIAFGADADTDGTLAPDEARLVIGWDCASWFVRNETEGYGLMEQASVSSGTQHLSAAIRTGWGGRLAALSLNGGNAPLFAGLAAAPPSWLHDCSWNICRITSRGAGAHDASFFVSSSFDGLKVIVR